MMQKVSLIAKQTKIKKNASLNKKKASLFFEPSFKIQRKCKDSDAEEKLFRKEDTPQATKANNETNSYINSLSSKGWLLPKEARSFFEPRFRHDFSDVKIHNNHDAAKSAQSINALAYTVSNNIVFNQNQFSPQSDSGKKLLAHELTHVAQQASGISSIQKKDDPSTNENNSNGWERDMESFSKVVTEHYLTFDRNLLSDSVQSIRCAAESAETKHCTLTTVGGIKVSVEWNIATRKVVVKACINDDCLACGYQYSVKDDSAPIFEKIKCWPYTG
jgi:hypothetical protein